MCLHFEWERHMNLLIHDKKKGLSNMTLFLEDICEGGEGWRAM